MIEDQHRVTARHSVKARDGHWNTDDRQSGAGNSPNRTPAPIEARQDHHGEPGNHETQRDHDPPPEGIECLAKKPGHLHESRSDACKRQPQELSPQRTFWRSDTPAAIEFFGSAPANLATRCLWHRPGGRKDYLIGRRTGDIVCHLLSAGFQRRAGINVGLACLGQHDHPLRAGLAISDTKHCHAALADTWNFSDGFFDFLRIDRAAGTDDYVLDAACDANVTSGHIRAVAAIEPTIVKKFAGLGLVVEIATGRRRSPALEPTFAPFAEFALRLIDNENFVAG